MTDTEQVSAKLAERVAAGLAFTEEVASLAAHRQRGYDEGYQAAVAEIVRWLRTDDDAAYKPADAIERGEFRRQG